MSKLFRNWGLKLAAVILAVLVWFIIMILADPTDTKTIYNLPVKLLNADLLTQAGKSYTVVEGDNPTISIRVSASASVLRELTAADFTATADVAEMFDVTGKVPIKVEPNTSAVTASQISSQTTALTINYEGLIYKEFPVTLKINNELPGGYFINNDRIQPRTIRVRGPEKTVVSQIGSVVAEVDVTGLTSSADFECELLFYTDSGQLMDMSSYRDTQVMQDKVTVTLDVFTKQTVPVVLSQEALDQVKTQVADGYRYTNYQLSVVTVDVQGLPSRLSELSVISIPARAVNMRGATENQTFEINLSRYLPEGISLMEGQEPVTVTFFVEELAVKEFEISGLKLQGTDSDFLYHFEDKIKVYIRALEADFVGFDLSTLSISANIEEYATQPGTFRLPVTITCSDSIFTPLENKSYVRVTVEKVPEPTTEATEESTEQETSADE